MVTSDAIARFRELESQHRSPPRGRASQDRDAAAAFTAAHIELYHLAQRIAADYAPDAQARLDNARRDVVLHLMERVSEGHFRLHIASSELNPKKLRRPVRWCEIMLTPELEGNLALSGSKVPYAAACDLREAHREQVAAVRKVVERRVA